ncbi:hypothetical protein SNA_28090 [Streptomyces natalensis ATCC 27448]|uniref:Uncharacterized protein n=1 Tax=Streptomyces natalensis ATCC 27448 TaxID=1240678 RepID=A0A0D7CH93_9ACTN|nr:hypothetical protein SNA_28090 [Streptomyces natalensis ATCC 27448]
MVTQPDIFAPGAEWLPELRQLLQAYRSVPVPAEECFVDSEEAPSRGMRSYLRVAVHYPGRPFRAAREIAEVVHLGINHWDVSACLATMPPIIPPRGKVRVDCLLAVIPYLAAYENDGYRVEPAPPDSPWEWREQCPNLSVLVTRLTGRDDAPTGDTVGFGEHLEAIEDFRIAAAWRELAELRGIWPPGEDWATAAAGLGAVTGPPAGLSHAEWFDDLDMQMAAHLKSVGYRRPAGLSPAYPAHDVRALW